MAVTVSGFLGTARYTDLELNSSPEALVPSAGSIFGLEIDNLQNTDDSYVKVYDESSSPTIGTTDPIFVFRVKAGSKRAVPLSHSESAAVVGYLFTNDAYIACVTTPGTSGSTNPSNKVTAEVVTD